MTKLSEVAKAYEPKQVKNIAELEVVSSDLDVKEETEVEFPYKYTIVDGTRYRIPTSVIAQLKVLLEDNPNLKQFKVRKSGSGMGTEYIVIPVSKQ